ncbi:hypothetical protein TIFTF001_006917 [Ficus carica]|uniref:Uncharacterized protein n=1 Tax=Ficus carica TaxID=3494 RepID=A0AA88CZ54_FICCA|nr:hypothetical protein TIFTF001_006917 [Ficus carica]
MKFFVIPMLRACRT